MRYNEIIESVPMNRKEFKKASSNRTFGFEVEVAYVDRTVDEYKEELENFINNNLTFDNLNDFWKKYKTADKIDILESNNIILKYGFGNDEDLHDYFNSIDSNFQSEYNNIIKLIDNIDTRNSRDEKEKLEKIRDFVGKYIDRDFKDVEIPEMKAKRNIIQSVFHRRLSDIPNEPSSKTTNKKIIKGSSGENYHIDNISFNKILELIDENTKDTFLRYIKREYKERLKEEFDEKYGEFDDPHQHMENLLNENDIKYEDVVSDNSVKPIGTEVISIVYNNIDDGKNDLEKILKLIQNDELLFTNDTTGLHINVGQWDSSSDIDVLKLLLFIGEKYVGDIFNRFNSYYAQSLIINLYNIINSTDKDINITQENYEHTISTINRMLLDSKDDYNSMNLNKLINSGYIEFRAPGGENYEYKIDTIMNFIDRISRVLDIAENPNLYRGEYLKKLYKIIKEYPDIDYDKQEIQVQIPELNKHENKKLSNVVYEYYKTTISNPSKATQQFLTQLTDNKQKFINLLYMLSENKIKNMVDTNILRSLYKINKKLDIDKNDITIDDDPLLSETIKTFIRKYL